MFEYFNEEVIMSCLQVPSFSYPRFIKLLQFSCYSRAVLSGLVISIGGLQDSLRKASISALLDYIQAVDSEDPKERMSREYTLSADIIWVLQQYKKCDRVIIPTLKVMEAILLKSMSIHALVRSEGKLATLVVTNQERNNYLTIQLKIFANFFIFLHAFTF